MAPKIKMTEGLQNLFPALNRPTEAGAGVDIVIIPGVRTIQPQEWRTASESWLEELVTTLGPHTQALLFAYEVVPNESVLPQLFTKGRKLLESLAGDVENSERSRPLVFICHSLGGIVLKSALCSARKGFHLRIIELTLNVIFLSTPYITRSSEQSFNILELILRSNKSVPQQQETSKDDNQKVLELCEDFERAMLPMPFLFAYEGLPSKIQGNRFIRFRKAKVPSQATIVQATASRRGKDEQIEVQANHNDICKLASDWPLYLSILKICQNAAENGPSLIARRENYAPPAALRFENSRDDNEEDSGMSDLGPALEGILVTPESIEEPAVPEVAIPVSQDLKIPCFMRQSVAKNDTFFGRNDVLSQIDEELLPSKRALRLGGSKLSVFALCGMGGIGKTQVAIEYAFTRDKHFDAVFWLYADDKTVLAQSMASIAREIRLEDASEGAQNLTVSCGRVQDWLKSPIKSRSLPPGDDNKANWLIIFDNVDDLNVVEDYWPESGDGSVLITSRDGVAKTKFQRSLHGIDMSPLTNEEGADFMESLTEAQPLAKDSNSLTQVAELFGGLPLAIAQMAGIILDLRLSSYTEFLQFYAQVGANQAYKMEGEETKLGYKRTLATVWALDRLEPETLSMFRVISLLDPDRVPEMILTTGGPDVELSGYPKTLLTYYRARAQLLKSSLIQVNEGQGDITVHRVVQEETRTEMTPSQFREVFMAALKLISKVWPFQSLRKRHDLARKEICEKLYPSVIRLKKAYDDVPESMRFQPDDQFAELLNDLGWYLLERGFVQESKSYYQLAQHICEVSPRKDEEQVQETLRMSHNNQTTAAAETNERKDCLEHSLIWLEMSKARKTPEGLPLEDYELAIVYNETGVAYGMNKLWDDAANYFIMSMEIMKKLENYEDTMLGWPEPNLGLIYWVQGKYHEAEAVLNEILEIHAETFGRDDTQSFKTGKILHTLGNLNWSIGNYEQSLDFHTRSFDQYMVTLGSEHHRTADVRHRLAMHYLRMGRLGEAEKTIDKALEIFGADKYHKPELARSTFKKSQILSAKGEEELSAKLAAEATDMWRQLVSKDERGKAEATEEDFDALPIFWSR